MTDSENNANHGMSQDKTMEKPEEVLDWPTVLAAGETDAKSR